MRDGDDEPTEDAKTAALHAVAASRDQYRDQVARLQGQVEALERVVLALAKALRDGSYV